MEFTNQNRELDWDDIIENDGPEYVLLPPGDYDFTVTGFQRERHPGSANLPPCNKAVLSIAIEGREGKTTLKHNLFLHSKCKGFLGDFFASIGQIKRGEVQKMDWSQVAGSQGRCKVGVREWTSREGKAMQSNEIKKFYDKETPDQRWERQAFEQAAFEQALRPGCKAGEL